MSTILIVDEDDQLRKSFHKLLVEEGYTVASAASGEDGLRSIQKTLPDLVILDMRLPGMNGLEAFRDIHRAGAQAAGHHHDGLRHHRARHRGHQARGVRLRVEALQHPRHARHH